MSAWESVTYPLDPEVKTRTKYGYVSNHEWLLKEEQRISKSRIRKLKNGREILEVQKD